MFFHLRSKLSTLQMHQFLVWAFYDYVYSYRIS